MQHSDYLRWASGRILGTHRVLKTISKLRSITTESRVEDREPGPTGLGPVTGDGSSVGLTVQWRTGQVSGASCFSRLQHQLFSAALTLDLVPSCSLKPRRQKAVHTPVKDRGYRVCVRETDTEEIKILTNYNQSSSIHWSIIVCWCPNHIAQIKGLIQHVSRHICIFWMKRWINNIKKIQPFICWTDVCSAAYNSVYGALINAVIKHHIGQQIWFLLYNNRHITLIFGLSGRLRYYQGTAFLYRKWYCHLTKIKHHMLHNM